jgi:hypothetical protein
MNVPRAVVSRLAVLVTLVAILVPKLGLAGIRGPGEYTGIVIFDRWDTCILFSGLYLMYISEDVKEGLRLYEGQAVQIDAIDVVQLRNPGDGLIKKYRLLGPAPAMTHSAVPVVPEGIVLTATGSSTSDGLPQVSVEIRNEGNESVRILTSEIGIALLTKKEGDGWPFDPSDGPSTAAITRTGVTNSGWKFEILSDKTKQSYSYSSDPDNPLPSHFDLAPWEFRGTRLTFKVPPGEYQFIFGYGGGVHEGKCLVSNAVSFDVSETGRGGG